MCVCVCVCVLYKFAIMTERKLRSSSSLVRDFDDAGQERSCMEAEADNASQETEVDKTTPLR